LINFSDIDYYFITDSNITKKSIFIDVKNAIEAGCKIVQYREKKKDIEEKIKEAKEIKKICQEKALFIINDNIDVALAVNSDGLHIGNKDISFENARRSIGENKIIGITAHNVSEAINAEKLGADYIGLAPIFKTQTKIDSIEAIGIKELESVRKNVTIPIVAVGGIKKENIKDVIKAGANSIASISAILNSDDVYNEVKEFCKLIKESKDK